MLRKITVVFLSLLIIISSLNFAILGVSADSTDKASSTESNPETPKGDFTVQVNTVEANTGDEVIVKLLIKNNPGVMAMTISITYDSSALEYMYYYYGKVFSDYTVKEHPSRNIIRLVISEEEDIYGDGAIFGIRFKIADNAEAKLHEMTVEYTSGDFCNNNLERLMPKIIPGGVNVAYNGTNCGHRNYDEWVETMAPTCTTEGAEQRTCTKCGHIDLRNTDPAGHDYEDKWTVDIPATKDSAGTMSRHCKNCNSTTDETNFTLEHSEEGNIENEEDGIVPDNDVTSSIIEEQHPEINEDKVTSSQAPTSSEETSSKEENISDNSTVSSKPDTSSSKPDTSSLDIVDSSDENNSSNKPSSSKEETSSDETNPLKENESSKNPDSSEEKTPSANTNSSKDNIQEEQTNEETLKEQEKNEEQIKDIIEIISPDKTDEEKAEMAVSVNQKLREVFPKFDTILKIFRTSFIILIIFVLL